MIKHKFNMTSLSPNFLSEKCLSLRKSFLTQNGNVCLRRRLRLFSCLTAEVPWRARFDLLRSSALAITSVLFSVMNYFWGSYKFVTLDLSVVFLSCIMGMPCSAFWRRGLYSHWEQIPDRHFLFPVFPDFYWREVRGRRDERSHDIGSGEVWGVVSEQIFRLHIWLRDWLCAWEFWIARKSSSCGHWCSV